MSIDAQVEAMDVLRELENGRIDVAEAVQRLEAGGAAESPAEAPAPALSRRGGEWLIPFAAGLAVAAGGGRLASFGGWWWLLAGPLLLAGTGVMALAAASSESPWIHLRVRPAGAWPAGGFALNLPLPIRWAGWALRVAGPRIRGLDRTAVDELVQNLEEVLAPGADVVVEVETGEAGEQIRVSLG